MPISSSPTSASRWSVFGALTALLVVATSCGGGDASSDTTVARGAAGVLQLTVCINNDTSGPLSGTGATTDEESFYVDAGQRVCIAGRPNFGEVKHTVMSSSGPAWPMQLNGQLFAGLAYGIRVCGKTASNTTANWTLDCGGNAYTFTGTVRGDSAGNRIHAEYTFANA